MRDGMRKLLGPFAPRQWLDLRGVECRSVHRDDVVIVTGAEYLRKSRAWAERDALAARVEELEAERDDLWNKLGEAMAKWNAAEARIAEASEALKAEGATNWERVQAAGLILLFGEDE